MDTFRQDYSGTLAGIGFESATFSVTGQDEFSHDVMAPDHPTAMKIILDWIEQNVSSEQIAAIGHRIVHGGPKYDSSQVITDEVVSDLQTLVPLDPEHLPMQISLIKYVAKAFPDIKQVACFDTAFFHDLPIESQLLPIPRKYAAKGLRRYGFHGLSYRYLLQEFEHVAGYDAAHGKVVFAHLGNGASLAAVKDGQPVDTSMGLTPAGGVPMSTRTGDLDPGVMTYLASQNGLSPEELDHMIGFESGLLGISETTSDMKKLLDIETDDPRAREAIDIFCYQTRKFIGAYAAALGGINSLVFSGGIGEVSAPIRSRICQGLGFLGIELDNARNQANTERISVDGAGVGVHVLPTNEAMTMARDMIDIVNGEQK